MDRKGTFRPAEDVREWNAPAAGRFKLRSDVEKTYGIPSPKIFYSDLEKAGLEPPVKSRRYDEMRTALGEGLEWDPYSRFLVLHDRLYGLQGATFRDVTDDRSDIPPMRADAKIEDLAEKLLPTLAATPSPKDLTASLSVDIFDGDRHFQLTDPGALPLRSTAGYTFQAALSPPSFAYIVLAKPDGKVLPVFPWTNLGDWNSRPTREAPISTASPFVFEPPAAKRLWWQCPTGPGGMFTIVLLARDEPLPMKVNAAELLAPIGRAALRHEPVIWFTNGRIAPDGETRLRDGTFQVLDKSDPLMEGQRYIREVLLGAGKHFTYSLAVAFAIDGR